MISCRGHQSSGRDREIERADAPSTDDAEALVRGLYQPYLEGRGGPPLSMTGILSINFQIVLEVSSRTGDGGSQLDPLDFDPVVGARDWSISDLSVHATRQGRNAEVVATFKNFDEPRTVTWDLTHEGRTWKVDDIHPGDLDVRQLLREARERTKGAAPDPEPEEPSDPETPDDPGTTPPQEP